MSLSYRTPGGSARGQTNRSIIRTSRNININPPVALNEPAIPEPWTDIKEESPEGDSGGECVGNLYQRRAGARRAKLTRRAQANLRVER